MRGTTAVFIDLETTGLNGRYDAIIEVGLLVWRDGAVIDSYNTLIDPQRPISAEISAITGITDDLVAGAPTLASVRPHLRRLISDHLIIGHNVTFDLEFLHNERLAVGNHRLDTLTLASILLPRIGRYDLSSLARALDLPSGKSHRALDDAKRALDLFLVLQKKAAEQDPALLEEIVTAGQKLGWPETRFFEQAFQEAARHTFDAAGSPAPRPPRLFNPPPVDGRALAPEEEREKLNPVDIALIDAIWKPGSNFSTIFPEYEPRPQQAGMARAVAEAFNTGQHLLVEAGTGTGKSLAYLVPAAFWATQNDRRVVISTNTINLQDQLIHKDIPALRQALPFELRVAVRKGKSNYLCARLFGKLRHSGPGDQEEMTLFARLLLWLGQTETGDINEISLRTPGERRAWRRLSGENSVCTSQDCAEQRCPLHFARRRAEVAHLLIVNHALLIADSAAGNQVLPTFRDLVIDEAHHLEDAVTNGLAFSADQAWLETLLDDLMAPAGTIAWLSRRLQKDVPDTAEQFDQTLLLPLRQQTTVAKVRVSELYDTLRFFSANYLHGKSDFSQVLRLTPSVREQGAFEEVRQAWDSLAQPLRQVLRLVGKTAVQVGELSDDQLSAEDRLEVQTGLAATLKGLEETRTNLDTIIAHPDGEMITWIESRRERISLHSAPLHIGPLVQQHIFEALETVVLTSATLRTAPQGRYEKANFDYIRSRLNAESAETLAVGSPFNYKQSTLLYLCTDIPEPQAPGYQRHVEEAIVQVAATLGGRTLVLFTSYKQLRETAQAIRPRLQELNIEVLAQSEGASRQILTEQFTRPHARAVLLGARSFWEGFDVPGAGLEAVILVKLPFDVPTDPIVGARSETYQNPFYEYSIPEAVLRFRQGFGRLIRRKRDEGIVVVLDKRVLTKNYGELFLNALPDCVMLRQRIGRLPEIIERWQNRERGAE
jgi:DNA polymerase-3 subunit epsilon/ATP-dependent DNA helicase DinG